MTGYNLTQREDQEVFGIRQRKFSAAARDMPESSHAALFSSAR